MELTYKQKNTYQIVCDDQGYVGVCNVITTTDVYGDKVFMVSANSSQSVPLDKMKNIIASLKG